MRYWPEPSVVAVLTFSISAGLGASTVTPGSTAPEASLTTPVMEACANTADGTRTKATNVTIHNELRRIWSLLLAADYRTPSVAAAPPSLFQPPLLGYPFFGVAG